jgi:hypothetical protein
MIFHFIEGFLNIASIAHATNIHSHIPDHAQPAHTANHAHIACQALIVVGSSPLICNATINQ